MILTMCSLFKSQRQCSHQSAKYSCILFEELLKAVNLSVWIYERWQFVNNVYVNKTYHNVTNYCVSLKT